MSQSRRRYTPEYKDEAVKLAIDSGRPTSSIAKDLGINEGKLGAGSRPGGGHIKTKKNRCRCPNGPGSAS